MTNKSSILAMATLLAVVLTAVQPAEAQACKLGTCDIPHAKCVLSCTHYQLESCGAASFRDEVDAPAVLPRLRSCRTMCARDKAKCYERMCFARELSGNKCFQGCVEQRVRRHEKCLTEVLMKMLEEEGGTTRELPELVRKLISCTKEYATDSASCNRACIRPSLR